MQASVLPSTTYWLTAAQQCRTLTKGALCTELERQGLTAPAQLRAGLDATQPIVNHGVIVASVADNRARAQFAKLVIDVCADAAPTWVKSPAASTLS